MDSPSDFQPLIYQKKHKGMPVPKAHFIDRLLYFIVFSSDHIMHEILRFSSYHEQQTFFCVVTCLKHSSLSNQTVAFWSANMSNFDSSASICLSRGRAVKI